MIYLYKEFHMENLIIHYLSVIKPNANNKFRAEAMLFYILPDTTSRVSYFSEIHKHLKCKTSPAQYQAAVVLIPP